MKIIIGDYMLNGTDEVEHEEFEIEEIIGHFHYKPHLSHLNDIAVIKIAETINYSSTIQPICLPTSNITTGGKIGYVSGWGRLNGTDSQAQASVLQKLPVTILNDDECRVLVRKVILILILTNRPILTWPLKI